MSRNRAWRRSQTNRVIRKRIRITNTWWWADLRISFGDTPNPYHKNPHKLHKYNLTCGCGCCKWETRRTGYRHVGDKAKGKNKRLYYFLKEDKFIYP